MTFLDFPLSLEQSITRAWQSKPLCKMNLLHDIFISQIYAMREEEKKKKKKEKEEREKRRPAGWAEHTNNTGQSPGCLRKSKIVFLLSCVNYRAS